MESANCYLVLETNKKMKIYSFIMTSIPAA